MTAANSVDAHQPDRPSWDCADCGKPWPCDPAREQLVAEYDLGAGLAMWMQVQMTFAIRDTDLQPPELYERFLEWTRAFGP